MAKLKTKKAKLDFSSGMIALLNSHNIFVDESDEPKLLEDINIYCAEKFKPVKKVVAWWTDIVMIYFRTYANLNNGEEPAFLLNQPKALNDVAIWIENRYKKKNPQGIWDKQTCVTTWHAFFESVLQLNFIKEHFSISIVHSQLDSLVSQLSAMKKRQEEIDAKILAD